MAHRSFLQKMPETEVSSRKELKELQEKGSFSF